MPHQTTNPNRFPNVIFDYGGVILNIDPLRSARAFSALSKSTSNSKDSGLSAAELMTMFQSDPLFNRLEVGAISEEEFHKHLQALIGFEVPFNQIETAWNALILDLPTERLRLLADLNTRHRTFLLSNTNSIHIRRVTKVLEATTGHKAIDPLFEKVYYSHQIGLRKPDPKAFSFVLEQNDLDPEQTVLLDDNLENLKSARSLGIRTILVRSGHGILDIFKQA